MAWAVWWHRIGFLPRRNLPDRLPWGSVLQVDALLRRMGASGSMTSSLASEWPSSLHDIPTRALLTCLEGVEGIRQSFRKVKGGPTATPGEELVAANGWGELYVLSPYVCPASGQTLWYTQWINESGEVTQSFNGEWAELRQELGLLDVLICLGRRGQIEPEEWEDAAAMPSDASVMPSYVDAPIGQMRREVGLIIGAGLMVTAMGVLTPLAFQAFTDKVLPNKAQSSLQVLVLLLTLAIVANSIIETCNEYLQSVASARLKQRLGRDVIRRLLSMPVGFFDKTPAGDLTKLASQVDEVAQFQTQQLLGSVVALLSLLVVLPLLVSYHAGLTLAVLGVGLCMGGTVALSLGWFRRRMSRAYHLDAHYQSAFIEAIKGVRTIKSLSLEKHFFQKLSGRLDRQLAGEFDVERLGHGVRALVNVQSRLVAVLVLGWGAHAAFSGSLSVGQLIAFYMLSDRLVQPLVSLVLAVNAWQGYRLAKEKLNRLEPSDICQRGEALPSVAPNTSPSRWCHGDICFEDVWFSYSSSERPVIQGLSLHIPAGKVVGLVGESGCGKSTLLTLLQGLHAPTKGRITIGGRDLRDIPATDLRHKLAVVSQSSFLFHSTIFENVRLGRLDASEDEVWQSICDAQCQGFINELAQRHETVIEEDGSNLSGGQRQRLSIARALVRNAPILLFDEATSALDSETETAVHQAIRQAIKGRTALMVAHRWHTLADCDEVVRLERGRIAARGSPEQMLGAPELLLGWSRHEPKIA